MEGYAHWVALARRWADTRATGWDCWLRCVGVSADGSEKHASFCSSEGLAYPLLSDPGGSVSKRYGSWIPPFSQRHTFIIDPDGILRARFVGVNPGPHSSEVLTTLKELQQI